MQHQAGTVVVISGAFERAVIGSLRCLGARFPMIQGCDCDGAVAELSPWTGADRALGVVSDWLVLLSEMRATGMPLDLGAIGDVRLTADERTLLAALAAAQRSDMGRVIETLVGLNATSKVTRAAFALRALASRLAAAGRQVSPMPPCWYTDPATLPPKPKGAPALRLVWSR